LEIIDVRCNLKQFDGLILLSLTPQYFTTDLRHGTGIGTRFQRDHRVMIALSSAGIHALTASN